MLRKQKTLTAVGLIAGVVFVWWTTATLIRARSQTSRDALLKNLRAINGLDAQLAPEHAVGATSSGPTDRGLLSNGYIKVGNVVVRIRQPDSPANVSQPIRSKTNTTSAAAGSGG
jgi:hypothetical protein